MEMQITKNGDVHIWPEFIDFLKTLPADRIPEMIIVSDDGASVFIRGNEVQGIKHIEFSALPNERPNVKLDMDIYKWGVID